MEGFYQHDYRPERVLVLEEDGIIQSMAAWFDTILDPGDGNRWKTGCLCAAATRPDARGRGYAGMLLKYVDFYLKEEVHCQAVLFLETDRNLCGFLEANGFRECFFRCPERFWTSGKNGCGGMLKWLYPGLEKRWDWSKIAYIGLGLH